MYGTCLEKDEIWRWRREGWLMPDVYIIRCEWRRAREKTVRVYLRGAPLSRVSSGSLSLISTNSDESECGEAEGEVWGSWSSGELGDLLMWLVRLKLFAPLEWSFRLLLPLLFPLLLRWWWWWLWRGCPGGKWLWCRSGLLKALFSPPMTRGKGKLGGGGGTSEWLSVVWGWCGWWWRLLLLWWWWPKEAGCGSGGGEGEGAGEVPAWPSGLGEVEPCTAKGFNKFILWWRLHLARLLENQTWIGQRNFPNSLSRVSNHTPNTHERVQGPELCSKS